MLLLATFALPVLAQDNAGLYPKKMRFGVAGQGFVAYPNRLGASLDVKLMMRGNAHGDVYNEFVVTGKAAHAISNNGGNIFKAWDKGKYDNISSLSLLAGYRMNFSQLKLSHADLNFRSGCRSAESNGFYFEGDKHTTGA